MLPHLPHVVWAFFLPTSVIAWSWRAAWAERAGCITWPRTPTCGFAIAASSIKSIYQGTINVLDSAVAAGAEKSAPHEHREHPD